MFCLPLPFSKHILYVDDHLQSSEINFQVAMDILKSENTDYLQVIKQINDLYEKVEKEENNEVIIPNGDYQLKAGDIITIISTARNIYFFFKKTGMIKKKITERICDFCVYLLVLFFEGFLTFLAFLTGCTFTSSKSSSSWVRGALSSVISPSSIFIILVEYFSAKSVFP